MDQETIILEWTDLTTILEIEYPNQTKYGIYIWGFTIDSVFIPYYVGIADNIFLTTESLYIKAYNEKSSLILTIKDPNLGLKTQKNGEYLYVLADFQVMMTHNSISLSNIKVVKDTSFFVASGNILYDGAIDNLSEFNVKTRINSTFADLKKWSNVLQPNNYFDDIDAAVKGAIVCKFRNAGQTCVCANRLMVQEDVYDEFCAKFAAAVAELTIGNGRDDGVAIGPLINEGAANDVAAFVEDAVTAGARAIAGSDASNLGKCFVAPTILTNVTDDMRVFREEIFGPVAPVFSFETEKEAIQMANDTEFGLACYFYSRDIGRIWRVGEALEYGIVGINEGIISNEMAPFGGVKESGQGREGSKYGLDDYLEIKYMCMGGIDP